MTAQHAAWIMNMWIPRGRPSVSVRRLLGGEFFKDIFKPLFKTKEEWEANKADIKKMAKFHEKVLRQIRERKREFKTVELKEIVKEHAR